MILPTKRLRFRILALVGAVTILAPFLAAIQPQNAYADEVLPAAVELAEGSSEVDGLTEATAAASCWEIKRNAPDSEDGVYWLWTSQLGAPDQFYCDQTTDGGGWVLVGRGREGWSESNMGSGTSAQVRSPATGTAAFTPRQLPSRTIEALIGGDAVSSLADGIRLHRATDQAGTTWQDVTFKLASPRDSWTWQFYNNQRIASWTIDGTTRSGGTTTDFGSDNLYRRVTTTTGASQGWMAGFGFGASARGSTSSTSYIWGSSTSMINPRPFTQVFLRPKLTQEDVALDVSAGGTNPITQGPGSESFAQPTVWGVNGLGNGPQSIEGSNEVSAFAEVDGIVFVGGNFTRVQTSASGANQQSQAYLAAFNVDTGEWISTFRPTFNNQIKALAAMPDGRIAIGGYFSTVNGQPRDGLAVLDAHTGQLDTGFTGQLINYLGSGASVVRGLDVQDGWLYAAGSFSHSTGGTESREVYTRAAARFSVSDGTPDASWNPEFNGTVIACDASTQGDRVYFAGYFSQSKDNPTMRGAAIRTADAQALAWTVHLSSTERAGYQQAVKEVGDRVWLGGSEHSLFSYSRDDFSLLSTVIGQRGGDFQAIASDGTTVYGGCHCFDAMYTGASSWPNVGSSWTAADRIYAAGAWSASTAAYDPDFSPELNTRAGAGAWALFVDSNGNLWEGGDFSYSTRAGYVRQWSGGYVRFAPRDVVAPGKPGNLVGETVGANISLTWNAVDDATNYDIINSGRVIASVSATAVTVPVLSDDTTYAVRAVDAAGNRSASTAPVSLEPPEEGPQDPVLIPAASTWAYSFSGQDPQGNWQDPSYDYSSWLTGSAPLGWGHSALGTTLSTDVSPKPITSYYARAFEIVDATNVASVQIATRADDGIIVYVNGVEVLRRNVDPETSGSNVYANAAVSAANALANPVTVEVPGNLFVTGTNVITAEVHSNYRSTPSHSFELKATAVFGTQPPPDEPDPPVDDPTVLLDAGSSWSYHFGAEAAMADWLLPTTDVSTWPSGAAPLGWGQPDLGTELIAEVSPKPMVSYFRSQFSVPADAVGDVQFTTRADDGIVLYLNGVEVERVNIDDGPFSASTYANKAVSAADARENPVVFNVSVADLSVGENTIAAEVHSNYRSTPSHSFELSAILAPEVTPVVRGSAPDEANVMRPGATDAGDVAPSDASTDPRSDQATEVSPPARNEPDAPVSTPQSEDEPAGQQDSAAQDASESDEGESTAVEDDAAPEPADSFERDDDFAGRTSDSDTAADESAAGAESGRNQAVVLAADAEWFFYLGRELEDDWMAVNADVSSWSEGPASFGLGQSDIDEGGTVLEIDDAAEAAPVYFRTRFIAPENFSHGLHVDMDVTGGAVIYVNGIEVGRWNAEGDVLVDANASPPAPEATADEPVQFGIPADILRAGENTIAVEVHGVMAASEGPVLAMEVTAP